VRFDAHTNIQFSWRVCVPQIVSWSRFVCTLVNTRIEKDISCSCHAVGRVVSRVWTCRVYTCLVMMLVSVLSTASVMGDGAIYLYTVVLIKITQ
jgi:hypothetical protein